MEVARVEIIRSKYGENIKMPKAMELNVEKVYVKKLCNTLQIIPIDNPWQNLVDSLENFTKDYMIVREQHIEESREEIA